MTALIVAIGLAFTIAPAPITLTFDGACSGQLTVSNGVRSCS